MDRSPKPEAFGRQETLQYLLSLKDQNITIKAIQKAVCDYFQLSPADLKSKKRSRIIAFPRQIGMYLSRRHTGASLPEIGRQFGGKDHSTVIHSYRKIEQLLDTDSALKHHLDQLCRSLNLL